MTELEVMQDAVKIGFPVLGTIFGATIGAVSTYFVTKLTHKKTQEILVIERRLTILEDVSELFAEFTDIVAKLWAESDLEARLVRKKSRVPRNVKDNLQRIAQKLHDSLPKLKKAESRLLLLGHAEAHEILQQYVDKVNEFRLLLSDVAKCDLDGFNNALGHLEGAFYRSLNKAYREV